jgi:hypothetical protein
MLNLRNPIEGSHKLSISRNTRNSVKVIIDTCVFTVTKTMKKIFTLISVDQMISGTTLANSDKSSQFGLVGL